MLFQESIWCGSVLKLTEINQNLSKLDFKTNEYIDLFRIIKCVSYRINILISQKKSQMIKIGF